MAEEVKKENTAPEGELGKYNTLMRESRAERLRKRDLAIFKEVLASRENEKVPEIVFKEYFADYFNNHEYEKDPTKLSQWIGLSGGYYDEVDLVNEAGEVVDTVPGFYGRLEISDAFSDVPLTDMVITYNNKRDRLAVVGERYINEALGSVERKIITDETIKTHEQRWSTILAKYATKETTLPTSDPAKITPEVKEKLQLNMDDDE